MNRTNTRSPQRSRPPHPSAFCEYLNLRAQSDCLAEMAITARKQSVKTSVKPSRLLDTAAKVRI